MAFPLIIPVAIALGGAAVAVPKRAAPPSKAGGSGGAGQPAGTGGAPPVPGPAPKPATVGSNVVIGFPPTIMPSARLAAGKPAPAPTPPPPAAPPTSVPPFSNSADQATWDAMWKLWNGDTMPTVNYVFQKEGVAIKEGAKASLDHDKVTAGFTSTEATLQTATDITLANKVILAQQANKLAHQLTVIAGADEKRGDAALFGSIGNDIAAALTAIAAVIATITPYGTIIGAVIGAVAAGVKLGTSAEANALQEEANEEQASVT